jgi:hypothetical protein
MSLNGFTKQHILDLYIQNNLNIDSNGDNTSWVITEDNSGDLLFQYDGTTVLTIDTITGIPSGSFIQDGDGTTTITTDTTPETITFTTNSVVRGTWDSSGLAVLDNFLVSTADVNLTNTLYVDNATQNVGINIASPSLDLSIGDGDTGLDWVSDGIYNVVNNNVQTAQFDNNNCVLIGKGISAVDKLHIHEDSATNTVIRLTNSATGGTVNDGLVLQMGNGGAAQIIQKESNVLQLHTNNTNRFTVSSSGDLTAETGDLNFPAGNDTGVNHNHNAMFSISVGQSVANATTVSVAWSNTTDFQNNIDLDITKKILTVLSAGVYAVSFTVGWDSNNTGSRFAKLLAGGRQYGGQFEEANQGNNHIHSGSYFVNLADNDTIELQVFQDSGGNLSHGTNTGEKETKLTVIKIHAPIV